MNSVKKTGSRLLGFLIAVVIVLIVINQPAISGNAARDFWDWLNDAASSIGQFLDNL